MDIKLEKKGQLHIVRCKYWKSNQVGVCIIRELFGVMTAENASSVIVVTSGIVT
ncbi:restriction endonuclease [Thermodesulfobacteriota bacterium]